MILVERHYTTGTQEIVNLCRQNKELYNRANFIVRQAWFAKEKIPNISVLWKLTKNLDCLRQLNNAATAQQTLRKCISDWSNFKKALNAYYKDSSKFNNKPKPPNYKSKLAQVIFFSKTIRKKPIKSGFIVPTNDLFKIKSDKSFKQVVITPKTFGFMIEVSYEAKEIPKPKLDKNKICTIDIGLNNLCAITYDQNRPILINGRILKSINQWFNKRQCKSRSRKRYFRIENYFHHVSKFIVELCVKNKIGRLIIGKNNGWKQNINLGNKTNQAFCSVPIELLLQKIQYKADIVGLDVTFTEEAYTSKASFYDNDPLPAYEQGKLLPEFSGKRKKRGLYVTKDGFALNADVNGSMNIGRKVIPEFLGIGDRSLAARPVVVNPLKVQR